MIIFFDWASDGLDGNSDHTGIVGKVESGRVYTIEGNSSAACQENSYPPCVPFGTRRFNNLSAVPCICGVCHHIPLMQGIRLLIIYAKYGYWILSNNPFCCSPTPKPLNCLSQA